MKYLAAFIFNVTTDAAYIKIAVTVVLLASSSGKLAAQNLVQYVQSLSGTAPSTTVNAVKHSEGGSEKNANTIPAVGLPFAMTQFTPQTRLTENKCVPPYFYKDSMITGFRATHWLSGSCTQDYGSVTIMPVTGKLQTGVSVPFTHADETATPYYYQLHLPAIHVTTEVTASLRCGIMQFTMQQDDSLYILVTPNSDYNEGFVKVNAAKSEVFGYNPVHRIYQGWGQSAGFSGYFFMQFEKVASSAGTFTGASIYSVDSIINKKDAGGFLGFYLHKGEQLRLRIGTSFSSIKGAMLNLKNELPNWHFVTVVNKAKATWEKALGQIQVTTTNKKAKRIFYTSMYHAMQHPRLFSDVDSSYPRFAGNYQLQKINGDYFDDFSMWDIYRAQLPLLQILQPKLVNQFVQSLILKAEQGGWLPIFPCWNNYTAAMIGDHATAFIASAYTKGIRNYDVEKAYGFMRKNAFETASNKDYMNGMGRRALPSYLQYGYIPIEDSVQAAFHKKEQVSRTLEYAFDDYALSEVAKGLNKVNDYKLLHQRAFNYKHVFDSSVGIVRGRYSNGKWFESCNADKREGYITEGTPRQYTFYVPQDVAGLWQLMGGKKALENALDSLFAKNEYWHGNEPGHQIPFMYNYTQSPFKTQKVVLEILKNEYSDGVGGLGGNDDAGQMSAWYIFAAMGFYPVNPVSNEYLLTTPLFDAVTIQLPNKKQVKIVCHKASANAIYINKVQLNKQPYNKNFINHSLLANGGVLHIWLQNKPTNWGSLLSNSPSSLSTNK